MLLDQGWTVPDLIIGYSWMSSFWPGWQIEVLWDEDVASLGAIMAVKGTLRHRWQGWGHHPSTASRGTFVNSEHGFAAVVLVCAVRKSHAKPFPGEHQDRHPWAKPGKALFKATRGKDAYIPPLSRLHRRWLLPWKSSATHEPCGDPAYSSFSWEWGGWSPNSWGRCDRGSIQWEDTEEGPWGRALVPRREISNLVPSQGSWHHLPSLLVTTQKLIKTGKAKGPRRKCQFFPWRESTCPPSHPEIQEVLRDLVQELDEKWVCAPLTLLGTCGQKRITKFYRW